MRYYKGDRVEDGGALGTVYQDQNNDMTVKVVYDYEPNVMVAVDPRYLRLVSRG